MLMRLIILFDKRELIGGKHFMLNKEDSDFYFQWHITNKCNNRCKHCYHDDYGKSSELSEKDLMKIANDMNESLKKLNYIASIAITGGEPFVEKEKFYNLLHYVDGLDRIISYDILTNGTLLDEEDMKKLKLCKKFRRIQVSLEGSCAAKHDFIRGTGDFDRVIKAIKLLKKHSFTVAVMTTITRNNMNDIDNIVNLLSDLKVDFAAFERFVPEGQGLGIQDLALNKEEIKNCYQKIANLSRKVKTPSILTYRALYILCSQANEDNMGAMCSAGTNSLAIMPNGDLYPCRRLPIKVGNVLEDGIINVWFSSEVLWNLRNFSKVKGKCKNCKNFVMCRGCRSIAYAKTGDYMEEDPQCWK